ncbi:uncharacterized protein LOC126750579 [Anthonomus grandis grandis]|uniref:uncharacterized protein LOC126750579 n=1 Tax=Anthonomus grandis grandis TaxID=2921223 RepID=UPI00216666D2|nr:uncharacterized protein LOC126750579 [Anthonomus grandis grandis]
MPRVYKKKIGPAGKKNYNDIFLIRAVAAVNKRILNVREAARQYGVPYTTLYNRVHGKHPLKYGRQPVLPEAEEKLLVDGLLICANWRFPLKSTDIRLIVQKYLNNLGCREKRFTDNLPGLDWFRVFMARNPNLTIKLAENTKRVRASVDYEMLNNYFPELQKTLKNVPPCNVINYDESNFVDHPGSVRVVVKRGVKHAHRIIDTSKTSTSVMFAISGSGALLPPYIVYKAKHLYPGWSKVGYPGSRYSRTTSGWFDSAIFKDWVLNILIPHTKHLVGPKVLIGDNLSSHLTLSVIQACESNDICFVLLPPNSTPYYSHLMWPLKAA